MTAEQLNIKMNLDIGDLVSDIKRVKTQLSGVAASVRSSIPRISSESKSASSALSSITRASKNVRESLEDIGDEAQDSLSDVARYSKTAATALKSMKNASDGTKLDINTEGMVDGADDINNSFESIQNTMQALMGLNVWQAMSGPLGKFKEQMKGVKDMLPNLKSAFNDIFVEGEWGFAWDWDELKDSFRKSLNTMKIDAKKGVAELKESFSILKYDIQEVFDTDGWKNFKKNVAECTKAVAGLVLKVAALAAALSAVLLTVNAIKISELGKQIYTNAQRTGMSAQAYQEWTYVLERAGIEADELTDIVKTLTEAQVDVINGSEDTIEAFKKLGLSASDVVSMSQQQLWGETVKRLQNIGDATQRTAIAYRLFGEDASKLVPILNLSNEQTQGLINTYNQLGGVMSNELLVNSQVLQGSLANLRVAWGGLKNTIAQAVIPVIITLVNWITTAIAALNAFLQVFFGLDLSPAIQNIGGGFSTGAGAVGDYTDAVEGAGGAVEKLKRSLMGFDELNVVPDPQANSGGGGGGGGGGGDFEMPDLGNANSIFQEASKQAEEFKKKMEGFFNEYKTQIEIIGAALAALGISKLLGHLGEALGLGDKFMAFVNGIAKLATSAIVITLQYTLANEFFDNFIDGEGIKNYLLGLLVSAIGTGVLYSMWGPAGAIIGLAVTAVAGIKAIIDNEGITNAESGTVALTSLGAAVAAIGIAIKELKKLGFFKWIADFVAAFKTAAPEVGVFAAMFPKLSSSLAGFGTTVTTMVKAIPAAFQSMGSGIVAALGKIGTAIKGAVAAVGSFAGTIGSALGLTGGAAIAAGAAIIVAAIAAIAGTIMFVVDNWKELCQAVKDFWKQNITPKLESICESFKKMWEAVKSVGEAFAQLGVTIWNALPQGLKDFLAGVAAAIRDVVVAIGEWFASIDWLGAIKTAFEFLGMVVVDIVGGVVMGAINALIGALDGLVQIITGVVEIVAGVVEAIVKLFSGDLNGAWEAVKKIGNGIVDCFKGLYKATIGVVVDLVKGIIDWFVEMWDVLVGHSIVPDMCKAIIKWFDKLIKTVVNAVKKFVKDVIKWFTDLGKKAIKAITDLYDKVTSWFSKLIKTVTSAVSSFVKSVVKWFTDLTKDVVKTVQELHNKVVDWFKKAINTVVKAVTDFVKNVINFFSDMYKKVVSATSDFVKNITDGFSKMIKSVVDAVSKFVKDTIQWFNNMIDTVVKAVSEFVGNIIKWFSNMIDTVVKAVSDFVGSIIQWFGNMINTVVGAVGKFASDIIEWFRNMISTVSTNVSTFVSSVIEWFSNMISTVTGAIATFVSNTIEKFTSMASTVGETISNFVSKVIEWFGNMFSSVTETIGNLFSKAVETFTNLYNKVAGEIIPNMVNKVVEFVTKLKNDASTLINNFVSGVGTAFTNMKNDATTKFSNLVDTIKTAWSNVKNTWDAAGGYFSGVWDKIKGAFSSTSSWFKSTFQSAWDGIKNVFSNVSSYFSGVWETIKGIFSNVGTSIATGVSGAVKGAVNQVLSAVGNKINGFIDAINGAIRIINKIPGVSIGYVGKLSIPQLEHGGIVTAETLARIGERGKREAVLPLDQHTEWMDRLADKIAARNGNNNNNTQPTKVVLQVGETELGYVVIDAINGITKQTGGLKLHMV